MNHCITPGENKKFKINVKPTLKYSPFFYFIAIKVKKKKTTQNPDPGVRHARVQSLTFSTYLPAG